MKQKKILIVDDSTLARKTLLDILVNEGYTDITEASGGREAVELCAKSNYDLVLLDIIMANLNGMEVLQKIGDTTKVVVISAIGQEEIIDEAKKYGAADYLVKPFDKNSVLGKVKRFLPD
jgi:two-component system chemotaxis response regulator CheY